LQAFRQGVAVDAEFLGSFGKIVAMAANDSQDEVFLKFFNGFFKQDPASDHLFYESFEFRFHWATSIKNLGQELRGGHSSFSQPLAFRGNQGWQLKVFSPMLNSIWESNLLI
jgi:hypothetical protein